MTDKKKTLELNDPKLDFAAALGAIGEYVINKNDTEIKKNDTDRSLNDRENVNFSGLTMKF